MLDMDIDFLNFLLNPNYKYIEKDIELIKNNYLENNEETLLEEKEKNFDSMVGLFANELNDLKFFIDNLIRNLISLIYIEFGNFFNISLKEEINSNNNFIEDILIKNNIKYLYKDYNLKVLKTDIRNYLINIINNSENSSHKTLANKALDYIDELIKKYDNIYLTLIPYINLIEKEELNKKKIVIEILKKIMLENNHLLNDNEETLIRDCNDYNEINTIFTTRFNLFFENIYDCNSDELILDISDFIYNLDVDLAEEYFKVFDICYKSSKITYKGKDALIQIIKDVNKFNDIYSKKWKEYRKNFFTNQLKKQLEETIDNQEIINQLANNFFESFDRNKKGHAFSVNCFFNNNGSVTPISFLICTTLKNISFNKNKIENLLFYVLSHEIKHIYSPTPKEMPRDIHDFIIEPYVDFISIEKVINLINSGCFDKKGFINTILNNSYSDTNFILIDLFEKYKDFFEKCLTEGNVNSLIELMGSTSFDELVNKLKNFSIDEAKENDKYGTYYLEYADNILNEVDKYQAQKNYLNSLSK